MSAFLNDVVFQSTTSGLSDFTVGAASSGYQTPAAAGAVNATLYSYTARIGTQFESGTGTYSTTGPTLARTTVLDGSSGFGVKVNFTSAPLIVLSPLKEDLRPVVTSNLTYYVRTDGSDSNSGLANTAGGAFRTIQKGVDIIAEYLQLKQAYLINLTIADGTYAESVVFKSVLGASAFSYVQVTCTQNVIVKPTVGYNGLVFFFLPSSVIWIFDPITIDASGVSGLAGVGCNTGGQVEFSSAKFVQGTGRAVDSDQGYVRLSGTTTIVGGILANCALWSTHAGQIIITGTISFSGVVTYSTATILADYAGCFDFRGTVFAGTTPTGPRAVINGGRIQTGTDNLTYIPGTTAVQLTFGGSYDNYLAAIGGTDTQVQFNDGSKLGGDSGLVYNKTTNALTLTGTDGATPLTITGGTQTGASSPALSVTQTWNNAATAFTAGLVNVTNTASAATSMLQDWQVGGVQKAGIDKAGVFAAVGGAIIHGALNSTTTGVRMEVSSGQVFFYRPDYNAYRGLAAAFFNIANIGIVGGTVQGVVQILDVNNLLDEAYFQWGGQKRVATQFDKTSDTTLANVTGLSVNVKAGRKYSFRAVLHTTSNVGGGVKAAIAGTATATAIIYDGYALSGTAIAANDRSTALAGAVGAVTAVTAATIIIEGLITVNAAGTLTVQFAQNASNGAASSVLVGSSLFVFDMP